MYTEIYYFSGTGNSLFIAKELQKRIPDSRLIPIASLVNKKEIRTKGKTIGLVFPVHALTIPVAIKRFIRKADFGSAHYIFAVATRKGTIFKGFEKIDQMLGRKNKKLNSHFALNMCNNDSRHGQYNVPTESDIHEAEKAATEKLDIIQGVINQKADSRDKDAEYLESFSYHPIVNYFLVRFAIWCMEVSEYIGGVNYFYADFGCKGCGICEKVCLSGKIEIKNQRPVWEKDVLCFMCFACLNFCPHRAVQISSIPGVKSFSKENGRYPHPYAAISDMTAQKDYGE